MSTPTVVYLVPALACVLSWTGAGRMIPRRWLPEPGLLRALTRTVAGAGVLGIVFYCAGRAGVYDRWLLSLATAVLVPVGLHTLVRERSTIVAPTGRLARALLAVVALALTLDVVAATAPPTSADALKYHLALPKRWLELGSVDDTFWRWEGFSAFTGEMLYGQALAIGGGSAASALGGWFAVLAALAVYVLGRELGGPFAGAAAAALFVLQGLVTWEATAAFVELPLTAAVALAACYAVRLARGADAAAAAWAGALCGVGAGVKYLGLLAAVLVAPLVLSRRRWTDAAVALAAGVAVALPWYAKNAIVAGNPVYPFLGGRWWTSASERAVDALRADYGVDGSPLRILALPFDLLANGDRFDRGQYVGAVVIPAALAALLVARRRPELLLLLGAGVYVFSWWVLSPQARFLLPALAVLAAVGGSAASAVYGRWPVVIATVGVVVSALWLVPSAALTRQLVGPAVGAEGRSEHVQRLTGTLHVLRRVASRTSGTVGFSNYPFTYYFPERAIPLGVPEFAPDVPRRAYVRRLQREDVRFILARRGVDLEHRVVRGCLRRVARYRARFVTSRSLGESIPIAFDLYSTAPCIRG